MRQSKDVETLGFLDAYGEILERFAAAGKIFGNIISLRPKLKKTPVPCLAGWSLTQMFQTTPNLQQCVKKELKIGTAFLTLIFLTLRFLRLIFLALKFFPRKNPRR